MHSVATILGTSCENQVGPPLLLHDGDFGLYWHDGVTRVLYIHDVNQLFHHISKVFYWTEILWLLRSFEGSELIVMFTCYRLLKLYVRYPFKGSHQKMIIKLWTNNNTLIILQRAQSVPKKSSTPTPLHHKPQAWAVDISPDRFMLLCWLCQILSLPSECRSRNWNRSGKVFPI